MMSVVIYIAVALLLFLFGIGGCLVHRHLIARILSLNVCGAGVFLLMVSVAYPPVLLPDGAQPADGLLHALVLTGIVVAVSATALGLAIASRLKQSDVPAPDGAGKDEA